jgi:hypothetical protein
MHISVVITVVNYLCKSFITSVSSTFELRVVQSFVLDLFSDKMGQQKFLMEEKEIDMFD